MCSSEMIACVPPQFRLTLRRSRSLPLLTALVTLIITSALLRRQTTLSISNDTPRPVSNVQTAHGGPNGPRHRDHDLRQITGHGPVQVTGRDSALVVNRGPDEIEGHARDKIKTHDQTKVRTPNQILRWDRALPGVSEEQRRPLTSAWLWRRYQEQHQRRETLAAACRKHRVTLAAHADSWANRTQGDFTGGWALAVCVGAAINSK